VAGDPELAAVASALVSVPRVVAVVVTYNRRELLLESLAALEAQSRRPDLVIVVDNASTDATAEAVAGRPVELHVLGRNTGGAGGFAYGMAAALRQGADLIWLMDDDTVPEPDALAALLDARTQYAGPAPALVASRVVWTDGRDHPMNTPRPKPLVSAGERAAAEAVQCIPVRSASFVSVLVDAAQCRQRGLPVADYFLWNDDFEFTTRLLRGNVGLLSPQSVVVHKTKTFGSTDADPGERFFFEVRNKIWMLTRSRSLAPLERLLYTGATLRRWLRTIRRSGDRPTLLRALRRGAVEALRAGPRTNEVVLAGADSAESP
jgi:GT2 family glycosyltransferase